MTDDARNALHPLIGRWRAHVLETGAAEAHVDALHGRLLDGAEALVDSGLDPEEAFLVALRRVGRDDRASREFAVGLTEDAWERSGGDTGSPGPAGSGRDTTTEFWVMLACAAAAAVAIKVPLLFGIEFDGDGGGFYARNLSFFVLPLLAVYFSWKRGLSVRSAAPVAGLFLAAVVFANAYPFEPGGSTEVLTAIHLPIALWLVFGAVYSAGDWRSALRRMEFVRFTGEWLVTYALIALGGGVLVALTIGIFGAIGLDAESFVAEWVLQCGAMGAVIVAAWLVETRRKFVGGMAPMLARVFTPLFTLMLAALLGGVAWTRGFIDVEREVLILFDLLLVVVVALVLYALSARDPRARAGVFDWLQLLLVVGALAVDVFALANIVGRLAEFGFSANRTAALGLNLILLANLVWSAVLQTGFVRARRGIEVVEGWQMRYLPAYALWAGVVVVAFPLLFWFA